MVVLVTYSCFISVTVAKYNNFVCTNYEANYISKRSDELLSLPLLSNGDDVTRK